MRESQISLNEALRRRSGLVLSASLLLFVLSAFLCLWAWVEHRSDDGEWRQKLRYASRAAELASTISDPSKRRMFRLIALNQDPGNVQYLSEYVDCVLKDGATPDELEKARNVVELAVYQIPPDRLEKAMDLLQQLNSAHPKEAPSTRPASMIASGVAPGTQLEELQKVDSAIWSDNARLTAHVDALRNLVAELGDDDSSGPDLQRAQSELERWSTVQRIQLRCNYIDSCLIKVGTSVDLSSDASVSILQAADNALPQFWGEDLGLLPKALADKVKDYPRRITELSSKVAGARAAPVVARIRQECGNAITGAAAIPKHEDACRLLERRIREINAEYAKITSPDDRSQADAEIEKVADAIRDRRKAQYNAYQKWALDKCDTAFKHWNDLIVYTSATNAKQIYDNDTLYEIDAGLLSSDVGRLHADVLNRLFPKMDPPVQVEMWRKTEQQKWGLDRF